MKVVGVVGGMGPQATWDFCRRLTAATPATRDQDHLRVLVDCDPTVPDRNAAAAGTGPSPAPRLAAMARGLVDAGAEVLCMPCVTAHAYVGALRGAAPAGGFVDMIDATVAALRAAAPQATRVGLLATTATVRSGLFQRAFARAGITTTTPDHEAQEEVLRLVYAVKRGDTGPAPRAALDRLADALTAGGAQALVLGCSEFPLLRADGAGSLGSDRAAPAVACSDALAAAVARAAAGPATDAGTDARAVAGGDAGGDANADASRPEY